MIITKTTPSALKPPVDFNVGTEISVPDEMPRDVKTASALAELLENSTKTLNRSLENLLECQPDKFQLRSQMGAQQVEQYGALITHCLQTLSTEQRQKLFEHSLQKMPVPAEIVDDFEAGVKSSNDFFDKLLELIDLIKKGYLAGYEHIIAAYSDFFKDFNEEITAKMKDWVEGANEGKEVKLNAGALRAALDNLIKNTPIPTLPLYCSRSPTREALAGKRRKTGEKPWACPPLASSRMPMALTA